MNTRQAIYLEITGIIAAAIMAILCGFIIIMFSSQQPMEAISSFLGGPLSGAFNIGTILNKAVPLIFTGLALSVVFQCGVFSMGAEGQLYVGAFVGSLVAVYVHGLPAWILLPLVLLCAMAGGALYGAVPGWLKTKWNANEIVTTLMLNFVAILTTSYLVNNVFKDPASGGYARMHYVGDGAKLGKIFAGFPAHYGVLIALLAAVVVYLLMYKTRSGYEMRLVGKNSRFANYGGISTKRVVIVSVMISGALAGLAGIVEILGVHGTYKDNFSSGLGFDGIIIALLARNHPIGVVAVSLFYAYLQVGATQMQVGSDVPRELAIIIQVMLVLFVSSQAIFTYLKQKFALRQKAVN
ncbi:ABC transporter permease [Paenibacillus alba]|uniref:ABC transporter permease n=1 Tax=Paenibacillus alba TaxID=1197127 RepID=A0ABU6G5N8_9BACL|nr:ABC transporter permease [Paenibacillus alba]MEC0228099.1 ABC transporter permease [Paenibacillus alba]NQX66844.1 ABC transporter permease [Paenibacillus alba]